MPGTFTYTLQTVNGDPATAGGNINITTSTLENVVFSEAGVVSVSDVAAGDTITIAGLVYNYEYLGTHDVRGDPLQPAAYIRIVEPLPAGSTLSVGDTFAMDLTGVPGDPDYPNLQNGNTKGTVASLDSTTDVGFPGVICFAAGTQLLTSQGDTAVEDLQIGDVLVTADDGLQPIMWISSTKIKFTAKSECQKPILIKTNALGTAFPARDLAVSPQHKIVISDPDGAEVLAPAKGLTLHRDIRVMKGKISVEYFHVLLPSHGIIFAENLPTESFYPGETALGLLRPTQRREIETLFPALKGDPNAYGPKARRTLTRREAANLMRNPDSCRYGRKVALQLCA